VTQADKNKDKLKDKRDSQLAKKEQQLNLNLKAKYAEARSYDSSR